MALIKATTKPPKRDHVPVVVDYLDAPMGCCGLGQGSRLTEMVDTGDYRESNWNRGYYESIMRRCTKEDVIARLKKLKAEAAEQSRNCILISLADYQEPGHQAMTAAEEEGFRKIHSFYNPNSGNTVTLLAYTEFASYEEYRVKLDDQDEDF